MSISTKTFDSYLLEFKENRENVINILKIVVEQKKVEEFKKVLNIKEEENKKLMREFIINKYHHFVGSISNMNECKTLVGVTDEVISQLENQIQVNKFS
jgi:hypothetical protein